MFTLKIETGNAAMENANNVADALREVANEVDETYPNADGRISLSGRIRDENGNTVGTWALDLNK